MIARALKAPVYNNLCQFKHAERTLLLGETGTLSGHYGAVCALPAARIGSGATVGPASLVVRGDEVPNSTRWQGNPIKPWNLRRKKGSKNPPDRDAQDTAA